MKSMELTMQLILSRKIKTETRRTCIGGEASTQFVNELNKAYENIVHWKRKFIYVTEWHSWEELYWRSDLSQKLWINHTPLIPKLLLQKPSKSFELKDHHAVLERLKSCCTRDWQYRKNWSRSIVIWNLLKFWRNLESWWAEVMWLAP